jgi:anti-sigma B factor antagonist
MQQAPLTIEEVPSSKDGTRVLRLTGPITLANLFDFQAKVRANTSRALILDMTGVPYVDSAGIGALVGAHVSHSKDKRSLAIVGMSDRVISTLSMTRVDGFFKRYDSIAAAEAAAG